MSEHDQRQDPQWVRHEARFGNFTFEGQTATGDAGVGVGAFKCDCCDEQQVVLAAMFKTEGPYSTKSVELSVSLEPATAEQIALEILKRVAVLKGTN